MAQLKYISSLRNNTIGKVFKKQYRNSWDIAYSFKKPENVKLCPTSFGSPSDANEFHFNGFDQSIEVTSRGYQYSLTEEVEIFDNGSK